jgi:hypothetical protein
MIPAAYRALLRDHRTRRLLSGLGVSSLGDWMSTVTIAWLAVRTAPADNAGLYVGLALAAYTLPGVVGALALGRYLCHRPARTLVSRRSAAARSGSRSSLAGSWARSAAQPTSFSVD